MLFPEFKCYTNHVIKNNHNGYEKTCVCPKGYKDNGFDQECDPPTDLPSNDKPKETPKKSDDTTRNVITGISICASVIGSIIGFLQIKQWKIKYNVEHPSTPVTWSYLLFCGMCLKFKLWNDARKGKIGSAEFFIEDSKLPNKNINIDPEDQEIIVTKSYKNIIVNDVYTSELMENDSLSSDDSLELNTTSSEDV